MRASLTYVHAHWQRIEAAAHREGYLVALYGSVLDHQPRHPPNDVDLIAVPKRPGTNWYSLVVRLCVDIAWRQVPFKTDFGLMNTASVQMVTLDGVVIDLQIREVQPPDQFYLPGVGRRKESDPITDGDLDKLLRLP